MNTQRKYVILLIGILLLIVLLTLFVYISNTFKLQTTKDSQNNIVSSPESNLSESNYSGKYLNAMLPLNWGIKEYSDNAGMDPALKTNSDYIGLTGFEIQENNQVIMKFSGVDGIGGINACTEVYRFSDTEDTYINNYEQFAKDQNLAAPKIVDLTTTNYKNLNIFGKDVRRVNSVLYWNASNESGVFNSFCGLSNEVINFDGPYFSVKISQSTMLKSYKVSIVNSNLTESEYDHLDRILTSLTYKN